MHDIWKLFVKGGVHIVGPVLVICGNPNIRKFYVDNLTARGYPTIGVTNLSEVSAKLGNNDAPRQFTPALVLMWGALATLEPDIEQIRLSYADSVPPIAAACPMGVS